MFEYTGLTDPSRLLNWEVTEAGLELRMHLVTSLPLGEIPMGVTMEPYHQATPRSAVSCGDMPDFLFLVGGRPLCLC